MQRTVYDAQRGSKTANDALADQLAAEGHVYQPAVPRFYRSVLSRMLNNRFYIGEIVWRGKSYPGKHQRLVSRETFDQCQMILAGKNRRYRQANHSYAGGLFRCAYCGQSLTGERIRRRLRGGKVREHLYYRCANNHRGSDHPPVRWRAEKLEQDVLAELDKMRLPTEELRDWFCEALVKAFADVTLNTVSVQRKWQFSASELSDGSARSGATADTQLSFRRRAAVRAFSVARRLRMVSRLPKYISPGVTLPRAS